MSDHLSFYLHYIGRSLDRLSFFDLLVIKLSLCKVHLLTSEVFDSESDPTKLDSIKFLDLVVKFTLWIL